MRRTISLPEKPAKREYIFSIRLTAIERESIRQLAEQLEVSPSHLVQHFTMPAKDELILPYSPKNWSLWLPEEVASLTQLLQDKASQVEISAALPNRNWRDSH